MRSKVLVRDRVRVGVGVRVRVRVRIRTRIRTRTRIRVSAHLNEAVLIHEVDVRQGLPCTRVLLDVEGHALAIVEVDVNCRLVALLLGHSACDQTNEPVARMERRVERRTRGTARATARATAHGTGYGTARVTVRGTA